MIVYDFIITKLDTAGVPYERHEHVAVRTSQEASTVRGTRMEEGAKALVFYARFARDGSPPLTEGELEGVPTSLVSASTSDCAVMPPPLGLPLRDGGGETRHYLLAVLAADRRVDVGKLRQHLGAKKVALASPEEVLRVTGCEVGGVPPFGSCLATPLQTYCDPSLGANTRITFNAGLRTHSLTMAYADWERVERPTIVGFAKVTT